MLNAKDMTERKYGNAVMGVAWSTPDTAGNMLGGKVIRYFDLVPGYESLATVYDSAIEQASEGKGRERHASEGEAYEDQIICEVARRVGLGYPLGQAVKKIYESQRIGGERGVAELLGALNYVAAAIIVMREGMETAPKAEGGCCQNGNDQPEEPEFKPGDAVDWNSIASDGLPAVYLREFGDFGHCVVRLPDGRERIVSKADLRRPETNHPDFPDGSTEAKPKFKHGDRVQYRVELPSVSDSLWVDGEYVRYEKGRSRPHVVYTSASAALELVSDEDIRPAPKAEGCEALVEKDAPQTPQELYKRIVANNPATFKARTPTGEELAEMAEEEKRG
jgi:hypothetical protein